MNDNDRNDGININDNNRSSRLKTELAAAVERRKTIGRQSLQAQAAIAEAKKALKRTPAYQALKEARARLRLSEEAYLRACETIFGITDEVLNNGIPNLPLFGRSESTPPTTPMQTSESQLDPRLEPENHYEPAPPRGRTPRRPRKATP